MGQTPELPTTADAQFRAGVQAFWDAVRLGRPELGARFFFPLGAYQQVKAISDATDDWRYRLYSAYDLDIGALHQLLGPHAASARLLGVDVPQRAAAWVLPGSEYNQLPYWRVYGTRVRYEVDGRAHSFGVFSLISWRGHWYCVHLGGYPHPAGSGIVDQWSG